MAKHRVLYRCTNCGAAQARWSGRCDGCSEWNSLAQETVVTGAPSAGSTRPGAPGDPGALVQLLHEVDLDAHKPLPTGIGELDRVLAGGLLPGSATLLGGEPGTGKSTLLLQALAAMAASGHRCLLVAAEEAAHQVKRRAARLGADVPGLFVVEATTLTEIELAVNQARPDVMVVDSIQAITDPDLGPPAGSLAQVRACAHRLVGLGKTTGTAVVLVGHVTKEGALAGPRTLEHLVDTVLSFEGDRYLALRALRAVKHRFGPTGETGLFEMGEQGLIGVPDPSSLFLGDRLLGSPGSAVTVPVEGHRPLLVEVQALVGRASQVPRRFVTGLDANRVGFLVAVLDKRAGVPVADCDIYVSVAGGARACEPAADLAVCLAVASSATGKPLRQSMVAIGEVGLGGELRRVAGIGKRLAEAGRLGFEEALIPGSARPGGAEPGPQRQHGLSCLSALSLREAVQMALGGAAARRGQGEDGAGQSRSLAARDRLASAGAGEVERGDDRGSWFDRAGQASAGGA